MVAALTTILLTAGLFFSGYIIQSIKYFIKLTINILLTIISFFGVKFKTHEKSIKMSDDFKNTYKEIKVVKISNKNIKEKSSIDWVYFGVFIGTLILIISNLNIISGNIVSNWLFSVIKNWKIIKSATDMNTLYTATLFSVLSFSITRILKRWKDTKPQRKERKDNKLKDRAVKLMSSRELLKAAKTKDETKKKSLL